MTYTRDYSDVVEDGWFDCLDYMECEECPYWREETESMGWDCNQCKNKKFCEKASKTGELVKCKFEPLNEEMIDKFCEDLASLLGLKKRSEVE